jgi:hypothetical protein
MKVCDRSMSHVSSKLHMIYMYLLPQSTSEWPFLKAENKHYIAFTLI